ncbi:hypothetical protein, partial [Streptomyces sp. gb1(2016)]|uniref:hypothetical protein n=1 Tax=Streptomyces sp. gb1(2016) TaxID=1828321 RepID=UPI0021C5734D
MGASTLMAGIRIRDRDIRDRDIRYRDIRTRGIRDRDVEGRGIRDCEGSRARRPGAGYAQLSLF